MAVDETQVIDELKKAWDAYEKNELDKAESIGNSILSESPDLARPYYLLGHINLDRKKFVESLKFFETALSKDVLKEISGFTYYWMGRVYEAGNPFEDYTNPIHDLKKAIECYKLSKENKLFPKDALLRLIKDEKTDYDTLQLYDEGILKFPDDPYFYIRASTIYEKKSNYKSQIEILQNGLKNCKKIDALNYFVAKYFQKRRQFDKARSFYLETIKVIGNSNYIPIINYLIGNCYSEEEEYSLSETYYRKSLDSNEHHTIDLLFSTITIIPVLSRLGKLSEIESLIEKLNIDAVVPSDMELQYGSSIWFDSNIWDEIQLYQEGDSTIEILEQTSFNNKKKQFDINFHFLKIILYKHKNEYLKRLASINHLKKYANNKDLHFIYSELKEAYLDIFSNSAENINIDNEADELINDLKKSYIFESEISESLEQLIESLFERKKYSIIKELNGIFSNNDIINSKCLFKVAYSLSECGEQKLAKSYYEKILVNSPQNGPALNNIGVIYEKDGDFDRALKYFKDAHKTDREKEIYQNNIKRCLSLIQTKIATDKRKKIPEKWLKYTSVFKTQTLDQFDYFEIIARISKVNQKYKTLIERDYNELCFNYLVQNNKASIVLSGSLIELVLTYYCEKKKIKQVPFTDSLGITKNKKLYDCVLSDLINYFESQKLFGSDFPHLGNLSRIYRNYIHPGRELKESINRAKAELCFISTNELLKKILA